MHFGADAVARAIARSLSRIACGFPDRDDDRRTARGSVTGSMPRWNGTPNELCSLGFTAGLCCECVQGDGACNDVHDE